MGTICSCHFNLTVVFSVDAIFSWAALDLNPRVLKLDKAQMILGKKNFLSM
jgi:hypothetical protein